MRYCQTWLVLASVVALLSGACAIEAPAGEVPVTQTGDSLDEPRNPTVQMVAPEYPPLQEESVETDTSATTPKSAPNLYGFSRVGDTIVRYTTPSGNSLGLNVATCAQDTWCCTQGSEGYEICYYNYSSSADDMMTFTLDGATSIRCTLLHNEDDAPRKLYFATDGGNNCVPGSNKPCFMLRSAGDTGAPVRAWASYLIACF